MDVLAEQGLSLTPIEIKSTATPRPELTAGLARWRTLAGDVARPGHVVYGGTERRPSPGGEFVPWSQVGELAAALRGRPGGVSPGRER